LEALLGAFWRQNGTEKELELEVKIGHFDRLKVVFNDLFRGKIPRFFSQNAILLEKSPESPKSRDLGIPCRIVQAFSWLLRQKSEVFLRKSRFLALQKRHQKEAILSSFWELF